ncbi:MAG: AraC family transcriptional regulator [Runella slithyformis]|nr:MAG: AraC family transcriptional regulator [Runella slithyformis]TAF49467.1 MAG: AraC family transcriptional regulator [Runella slithyformis]
MSYSQYRSIRSPHIDNIELLAATHYNADFPDHSHETFCITLVENGTFKENEYMATAGTIYITNPNEIHRNDLVFETGYCFKTFYVSPDFLKKINRDQNILFESNGIENPILFNQIAEKILQPGPSILDENNLISCFDALINLYAHNDLTLIQAQKMGQLDEVKAMMRQNLSAKIAVDDLASMLDLDKFKFIRLFKKCFGLSPISYLTLLRVEHSKLLLKQGASLVEVALESGFYDQSHYTNYFKHYVGVTPKVFQNAST